MTVRFLLCRRCAVFGKAARPRRCAIVIRWSLWGDMCGVMFGGCAVESATSVSFKFAWHADSVAGVVGADFVAGAALWSLARSLRGRRSTLELVGRCSWSDCGGRLWKVSFGGVCRHPRVCAWGLSSWISADHCSEYVLGGGIKQTCLRVNKNAALKGKLRPVSDNP